MRFRDEIDELARRIRRGVAGEDRVCRSKTIEVAKDCLLEFQALWHRLYYHPGISDGIMKFFCVNQMACNCAGTHSHKLRQFGIEVSASHLQLWGTRIVKSYFAATARKHQRNT
jgi:hypothetical protein